MFQPKPLEDTIFHMPAKALGLLEVTRLLLPFHHVCPSFVIDLSHSTLIRRRILCHKPSEIHMHSLFQTCIVQEGPKQDLEVVLLVRELTDDNH
jgi:hypothetical protein